MSPEMMVEVMRKIVGEQTDEVEETEQAEELAESISPVIFNMFDEDANGIQLLTPSADVSSAGGQHGLVILGNSG